MDLSIFTKLKQYQAPGKFRKEVLSILVKFLSDDKIKDLIEAFRYLDKDETGYITYEDLKEEVMSKWLQRMPLAYEELHDIFAQFSCGNSTEEKIKYTDFIIATLDRKVYMNKKLIWNVFNYIDVVSYIYIYILLGQHRVFIKRKCNKSISYGRASDNRGRSDEHHGDLGYDEDREDNV